MRPTTTRPPATTPVGHGPNLGFAGVGKRTPGTPPRRPAKAHAQGATPTPELLPTTPKGFANTMPKPCGADCSSSGVGLASWAFVRAGLRGNTSPQGSPLQTFGNEPEHPESGFDFPGNCDRHPSQARMRNDPPPSNREQSASLIAWQTHRARQCSHAPRPEARPNPWPLSASARHARSPESLPASAWSGPEVGPALTHRLTLSSTKISPSKCWRRGAPWRPGS